MNRSTGCVATDANGTTSLSEVLWMASIAWTISILPFLALFGNMQLAIASGVFDCCQVSSVTRENVGWCLLGLLFLETIAYSLLAVSAVSQDAEISHHCWTLFRWLCLVPGAGLVVAAVIEVIA